MVTAVVSFHVKESEIENFKKISMANAAESRKEPGIRGFEVLQQQDDATRFLFIETYATPQAQLSHRETAHYLRWKAAAESLLAEARTNIRYDVVE